MSLRVVLVEPEFQMNIGACARVMKNFGYTELFLVNPRAKLGQDALKYSVHAQDVIKKAKIVDSIDKATSDCGVVIGTTAIQSESGKVIRSYLEPRQAAKKYSNSNSKIALLIGGEGSGLNNNQLELCDLVVRIPTHHKYRTMNISHALGTILYDFFVEKTSKSKGKLETHLTGHERKLLLSLIDQFVKNKKGVRNSQTTSLALRRSLIRGISSSLEGRAIINLLKKSI